MSEGSQFPVNINGTIPEASVRRLAEGIADLVSPITEAAGMLGDSIRGHREAAAAKRIQAALDRAKAAELSINPAPVKFIASWSDGASLEGDGSSLNEIWENLLLSGLTDYKSHLNAFVEILRKFGPDEAKALKLVIDRTGPLDLRSVSVSQAVEMNEFPEWLVDQAVPPRRLHETWQSVGKMYRSSPKRKPTLLGAIATFQSGGREYYYDPDFQELNVSFDLIRKEGLVAFSTPSIKMPAMVAHRSDSVELITYSLHVAHLTQLGYSFARACLQPPVGMRM